jgi:hypothetical protein
MYDFQMTNGVSERLKQDAWFSAFVTRSLARFIKGDWGQTNPEDSEMNDRALKTKQGIITAKYVDSKSTEIFITKDEGATTVLFPEEY